MIFTIILSLNMFVAMLYLMWNILWYKGKMEGYLIRTIVMIFCPIVGILVIFLRWLWFNTLFHKEVDLSDVVFSKERVKAASRADEERERNIAPIEEAIVVTDRRNLRELMLNVVRGDVRDSISSIALALESEDSEISHYAASVLQGALNDFRTTVQKDYQMILDHLRNEKNNQVNSGNNGSDSGNEDDADGEQEADPVNADFTGVLISYMNEILEKNVFTKMEQYHYTMMMDEIGELLFESEKDYIEPKTYEYLCMQLLKVEEYDKCEKWCRRLERLYPDVLATYTCQLRLYFSMGDRDRFFIVMRRLKNSNVVIDKDTLELIRVFS